MVGFERRLDYLAAQEVRLTSWLGAEYGYVFGRGAVFRDNLIRNLLVHDLIRSDLANSRAGGKQ